MNNCDKRPQRQHFRRSILHASVYSTQRIENDVSARLPKITSASCDLDLWPPDPRGRPLMQLPRWPLAAICIEIASFVFKIQRSQVANRRTNRRTDGQTKGQVENIMHPARLDWHTNKNSICLLTVLRSCVFMTLSAIAKFVVHLLEERRCRLIANKSIYQNF